MARSTRSIKLSASAVSMLETDVHELAADPEGHGLDAREAYAYKVLDQAHDRERGRLRLPDTEEQAEVMVELLTDLSNSADAMAENGPKENRAIYSRIARSLATVSMSRLMASRCLEALFTPRTTMKRYEGRRTDHGCAVVAKSGDRTYPLDPRTDLANHSPTGFEWGYAGSGPSQLALALLADAIGDKVAMRHYQRFKATVVESLQDRWSLTSQEIAVKLAEISEDDTVADEDFGRNWAADRAMTRGYRDKG